MIPSHKGFVNTINNRLGKWEFMSISDDDSSSDLRLWDQTEGNEYIKRSPTNSMAMEAR
jgi:hypothetical protein